MNNLVKSFKSLKWYEYLMIIIMLVVSLFSVNKAFRAPTYSSNPPWLAIINFISAICGLIGILFQVKASISNFIFGILNVFLYAVFLVYHHIWGTLGLEILVYLPLNIAGWISWAKYRDNIDVEKTKVKKSTKLQILASSSAVLIIGIICYLFLSKLNGTTPLLDAFVVSLGIVASVLQVLRYREQYIWWILQDIVSITMYIIAFDAIYLTKKSIYLIMSIMGLYNWSKLQKSRNVKNN